MNVDLNGKCGIIVPQGCAQAPVVPGTLKVRLESNREVAAKPANLELMEEPVPPIEAAPQAAPAVATAAVPEISASEERVLQKILEQIKAESERAALAGAAGPRP